MATVAGIFDCLVDGEPSRVHDVGKESGILLVMPYKDPIMRKRCAQRCMRTYRATLTAAKVEKIENGIKKRKRWPVRDLAWAAGMFEGEGTAAICGSRYSRSVVSLCNTDFEIVAFFQKRWPGLVREVVPKNSRHKPHRTWRLQGNQVFGFLLDVMPFLRTTAEKEKARLLMASQRARWAGYRLPGHLAKMAAFKVKMHRLNLRGRQSA